MFDWVGDLIHGAGSGIANAFGRATDALGDAQRWISEQTQGFANEVEDAALSQEERAARAAARAAASSGGYVAREGTNWMLIAGILLIGMMLMRKR